MSRAPGIATDYAAAYGLPRRPVRKKRSKGRRELGSRNLSERVLKILFWYRDKGRTYGQIAARLGLERSTVAKRCQDRARRLAAARMPYGIPRQ